MLHSVEKMTAHLEGLSVGAHLAVSDKPENKFTESLCRSRPLTERDVAYDFVDDGISVTGASDSEPPIISVAPLAQQDSPTA